MINESMGQCPTCGGPTTNFGFTSAYPCDRCSDLENVTTSDEMISVEILIRGDWAQHEIVVSGEDGHVIAGTKIPEFNVRGNFNFDKYIEFVKNWLDTHNLIDVPIIDEEVCDEEGQLFTFDEWAKQVRGL